MTGAEGQVIAVDELFGVVGLSPLGPVAWKTEISEHCAGIYVVALAENQSSRKSSVVDVSYLPEGERKHWLADQVILYIGQTTKQTLTHRVHQFYIHKYGNKSPHRGGQAIHLLNCDRWVFWAPTPNPRGSEGGMLEFFKANVRIRPFANRIG